MHDYCTAEKKAGRNAAVFYLHNKGGCCVRQTEPSKEGFKRAVASWREVCIAIQPFSSTNPPSHMPPTNTLSPHTFPVSSYPLHNIGYEYFQYRISIHMLTLTLTLPFTHRTIYPITIHIGYEHFQYRISIHLFTSHVRWVQRLWYGISR